MEALHSAYSGQVTQDQGPALLALARGSIEHGLSAGTPQPVVLAGVAEVLRRPGASFVSLHREGRLRGCIGNLEARQPLAVDVAENAFNAAFRDPRFGPLQARELVGLQLEVSVLSPSELIPLASEADLLERLQPHVDGILLEEGFRRSTFLPAVWQQLPDPRQFLRQLKRKAGLPEEYWSPTIRVYRYRTVTVSEQVP